MASETKLKIVQASLELFRERGYPNVKIEEICEAADVTRSTFYYHFKTKAELLDSVYIDYWNEDFMEMILASFTMDNHWEQLLQVLFPSNGYTMRIGHDLQSWIMATRLTEKSSAHFFRRTELLCGVVEKVIQMGQSTGQFKNNGDAKKLANLIVKKYIIGNTYQWCMTEGAFDLFEGIKTDVSVILGVEPELLSAEPDAKKESDL